MKEALALRVQMRHNDKPNPRVVWDSLEQPLQRFKTACGCSDSHNGEAAFAHCIIFISLSCLIWQLFSCSYVRADFTENVTIISLSKVASRYRQADNSDVTDRLCDFHRAISIGVAL